MQQIKGSKDRERALDILGKAFISSPGMTWMLREKSPENLRSFLSFFLAEASARGGAWLSSDKKGVLFFYHLRNRRSKFTNIFRKLYVILFIIGLKNAARTIRYKKIIDSIRPRSGWFGWLVATESGTIGCAAGYEMKNEMFRLADESNEPIYLETTTKRAYLLYKALGYTEYAQLKHPYADLNIWFLKREPRPAGQ